MGSASPRGAATQGSALDAAGFVGTWSTDVAAGRSVLEGRAAALLAGDPRLAGEPLPMEIALGRIHPEDRIWVFARIRKARTAGGRFSAEFRILDPAGNVRWILNRGCLIPDAEGAMRGCGAYIDTTDSHRDLVFPTLVPTALQNPLDEAAEYGLRTHEALARSGDEPLSLLADMLLLEIGRALAHRPHA